MKYKNFMFYLCYYFKHNKRDAFSFLVNLLILIYTLCSIEQTICTQNIWLLLWFVIFSVLWQLISTLSDISDIFKTLYMKGEYLRISFDDTCISEKEKKLGFHSVIQKQQYAIISEQLNESIQSGNLGNPFLHTTKEKKVEEYIKRNFKYLNFFLHSKLEESNRIGFHNERLIGLAEDIEPGNPIGLYKSCYYDAYLTNFIHFYQLFAPEGNAYYSPLYYQYGEHLPDISSTVMSNQIGVSTIGFTCDGYVFFLQQNTKADASPEMITPSGSGAANFSDLSKYSFSTTIENATNRELFEEGGSPSLVTPKTIAKTKIIGYFRWINKGGKPDFLSISKLRISLNSIAPEKKEQTPQIFSKYCINNQNKTVDFYCLDSFLCEIQNDSRCSFPLFMNITILRQFYEKTNKIF